MLKLSILHAKSLQKNKASCKMDVMGYHLFPHRFITLLIRHLPSAGDTLPSAVRTKCVILVFLAFLFWLPTSISMLVVPWTSGHIMAMGAHDLAFEAESSMVGSVCTTAVEKQKHQMDDSHVTIYKQKMESTNTSASYSSAQYHYHLNRLCLVLGISNLMDISLNTHVFL